MPELVTLTWAGAGERVTGIEPANPHISLGIGSRVTHATAC
jgi:hypothetical protein